MKSSIHEILHQSQETLIRGKYKSEVNKPKGFHFPDMCWNKELVWASLFSKQNSIINNIIQDISEIKCPQNHSPKSRKHWSEFNISQLGINQTIDTSRICAQDIYMWNQVWFTKYITKLTDGNKSTSFWFPNICAETKSEQLL